MHRNTYEYNLKIEIYKFLYNMEISRLKFAGCKLILECTKYAHGSYTNVRDTGVAKPVKLVDLK